ncbi:MAG: chemotaxis protein CheW [Spirochaetales bacterium]
MTSSDPLDTFRDEAADLLTQLESALMQLEDDPDNSALIDEAFRSLHTIKGSGNMFGLDPLVSFTHTVETAFALVRDGKAPMSQRLVEIGLAAKDQVAELVRQPEPDEELLARGEEILADIRAEYPSVQDTTGKSRDIAGTASSGEAEGAGEENAVETTFRVRFAPEIDLFREGSNPLIILKELKELGEALIIGYTDAVPQLDSLDPEACYLRWDILLTTNAGENAVRDVFIFVEDSAEIVIEQIDSGSIDDTDLDYKRLGEILVARGDLQPDDVERAVAERGYIGDILVERGYLSEEQVQAALQEQQYVRQRRETRTRTESESQSNNIKVSTEKLDTLVNLVGEFVSAHASLANIASEEENPALRGVTERLETLIRDVRDLAMDLHMVPVATLFSTFRRLIRDLSRELGKEVQLELEGTDTELDKNVIDRLKDPMLHIIRNSLDHGMETPEAREAAGKPRQGTLRITASYSGASVAISVADDGAGIDTDTVLRKAIERGIVHDGESMSLDEIHDLIFAPGFSTAEKATDVSGRGVGMDVVRSNIESLGGSIRLQTEQGAGTTVYLRIPLTLAIVEGLLVRTTGQHYLVNISNVLECFDYSAVTSAGSNQNLIEYRGRLIPFVHLEDHFGLSTGDSSVDESESSPATNDRRQLLVVSNDERILGLVVDEVLDTFQSVVKSLGKMYEDVPGVSGAVILGDGDLALMLDVERLTRLVAAN